MHAPTHVQDLATACVASVKATTGVELDFQHETLPLLDHYAREHVRSFDEIVQLVAPMTGAYFGEVIRRHAGDIARWHAPEGEYPSWRVEMEPVFFHFNPVGIAVEVISEAMSEGWSAHLQVRKEDEPLVKHATELFGDVREDDYWTFAMRFETIEQVIEALVRQVEPGKEKSWGSADYANAIARKTLN